MKLRLITGLGLWLAANSALFTLLGHPLRRQLETGLLRPRSWLAAGGLCVVAALGVLATGWGFLLLVLGSGGKDWALLSPWLLLAAFTPLGFVAVGRLAAIEAVLSEPWRALVLEDR